MLPVHLQTSWGLVRVTTGTSIEYEMGFQHMHSHLLAKPFEVMYTGGDFLLYIWPCTQLMINVRNMQEVHSQLYYYYLNGVWQVICRFVDDWKSSKSITGTRQPRKLLIDMWLPKQDWTQCRMIPYPTAKVSDARTTQWRAVCSPIPLWGVLHVSPGHSVDS